MKGDVLFIEKLVIQFQITQNHKQNSWTSPQGNGKKIEGYSFLQDGLPLQDVMYTLPLKDSTGYNFKCYTH